jgi:mono/diheme cytochrome c family protein
MRSILAVGGLLAGCLVLASAQAPAPARSGAAAATKTQSGPARPAARGASTANAGELKFRQNCSRCHNAPQELSSRISGTVVQHMRVRASLSEADAQAILHYLAP